MDAAVNPTELRQLLDQCGLSQRAAARALEVNERIMRQYCVTGSPLVVDYALRWLLQNTPKYCEHEWTRYSINIAESPLDPPQLVEWVKCRNCGQQRTDLK